MSDFKAKMHQIRLGEGKGRGGKGKGRVGKIKERMVAPTPQLGSLDPPVDVTLSVLHRQPNIHTCFVH